MASLGSLVVSLSANTAQFTSDLGKAAHESAKRMEEIEKTAAAAGKAIAAAFSAGAGVAAALVKQAIDNADAMDDLAQKTGLSMGSLAGLSHIATIEGKNIEGLTASLSKLSAATADAAVGQGEAAEIFKALGIRATDSSGKLRNTDSVLTDLASKFSEMEDGAAKTALAMGIFGKSGADMIPILNMGASGIAEATAEAAQFGLVLDGETAAAAANFNDNLTRLNAVKEGFANQIMKEVLPSLEGLSNRMIDSARTADGLGKAAGVAATGVKLLVSVGAIGVGAFKTLGEYMSGAAASLVALISGDYREAMHIGSMANADFVENVKSTVGNLDAIWSEAADKVETKSGDTSTKYAAPIIKTARKSKDAAREIVAEVNKAYEAVEKMIDGLTSQADLMGKSAREADLWKAMMAGATQEQLGFIEKIHDGIDAKQRDIDMQQEAKRIYEETRSPLEQLEERYTRLNELLAAGAINHDTYSRAVVKAQEDFENFGKSSRKDIEDLQRSIEGWGREFTDTFVDGAMRGKISFSDLANSIIRDILRITTQKLITDKLLGSWGGSGGGGSGILGFVSSAASSLFGGGSSLSVSSGGASTNSTGLSGRRAAGGPVNAGQSYLVGEKGPEIFKAAHSGTIIPTHEIGRLSGGASVQVVQHINVDSRSDQASIMQAMVQAKNAAIQEIQQAIRSGSRAYQRGS